MLNNYSNEDKVLMAVDCIIFGFDGVDLKILLIKRNFEPEKGKWSLMGGFLKNTETLDEAANRVLFHLTGFENIYMEQLYNFSNVDRDPADRTLSVAYYALINIQNYNEKLLGLYSAEWFSINDIPNLIFDHSEMIQKAMSRLRHRTRTKPVGFELLPEKFTMRQLRTLYEVILAEDMDKRNFINKFNSLKILNKLEEKDFQSSKKGSYLYAFNEEKYHKMTDNGFIFKI